jgi:hypothetical protein
MAEKLYKPDPKELLELRDNTRKHYEPVFSKFDEDDDMYELNFKAELNMPEEFKDRGIVLPTARDFTDACVDHTNVYNARVFVNRKGNSDISADRQEKLRKICTGLLYRFNVEATISEWRVLSKYFWVHGSGPSKQVWDADLYPEPPQQKPGESEQKWAERMDEWRSNFGGNIPVAFKAIHPHNIMADPYEMGGRFVWESRDILVYDAKSKYGWKNLARKGIDSKVRWDTWMNRKWRCEFFDDEPLVGGVRPHNYGMTPYVFMDTGLGNIDKNNDPVKRYVGILRYVKDLLISESRNYSIADVVLALESWPWYTIEGDDMGAVTEIHRQFGEVTRIGKNKLVAQVPAMPPAALQAHQARTAGYLATHISPAASRGESEEGVRSAAHFREVMGQVTTRYQYSTEAFKHGAAKILSNCLRVMKNVIPGEFNVWARTPTDEFDIKFSKADLVEPFTCYVEFAPVSEEDEYRRHDDAERLVQSGIVSPRWARTQMSNVDPDAIELDIEIEKMKNDPAVAAIKSQYIAMKWQQALGQRAMAEGTPMAPPMPMGGPQVPGAPGAPPVAAQQPGRRMVPPIPNTPTPGSAQGIQNQLKNVRSRTPMNSTQGRGINAGGNKP